MATENKKKPLVIVDIQPAYEESMLPGYMDKVVNAIEKAAKDNRPILVFYNSEEFSGSSSDESRDYFEFNGLSSKAASKLLFVEKEYAFYRNWMDEAIDDKLILAAVKMMHEEEIHDTRNFKEHHWEKLSEINGSDFFPTEDERECYILHTPYFDCDFDPAALLKGKEIEMMGGGRYECLEELKLHFEALGAKPVINEELSYGAHNYVPEHKKEEYATLTAKTSSHSTHTIKPKM